MPAPRPLSAFEPLEDRSLLTAFGVPWADPGHMTLSFVPDGTATPTGPSSLFATMSASGSTAGWQREILRAFQTWAVNANINVGLVADGGQAFGALGAVQGDSRFGDVRVGAAPLDAVDVAAASPFSWAGTTFAGDVLFNNTQKLSTRAGARGFDVFSVALHEAGHVFGVAHTDHDTVMNAGYVFSSALSADEIATLQALYGARTGDTFEGSSGNGTLATASNLPKDPTAAGRFVAGADLTTAGDVDFFKFKATTATATVTLQAKGLSLLQARVSVYDSAGKLVASGSAADLFNNDVTLRLTGLKAGGTYTVKVESATPDVFGVGGYRLTADTDGAGATVPLKPLSESPVTDGHTNDTRARATNLVGSIPLELDSRFDVTYRGAIEDATDTDFYLVRAPKSADGGAVNLNVVVWSTDGALAPRIRVLDASGKAVAFRVLANDTGLMSVVVENVAPNKAYYLQVSARAPDGANNTGGYFLGADFNEFASPVAQEIASNALSASVATDVSTFDAGNGGIYQFLLSAEALTAGTGGVKLTVTDATGKVVFALDAVTGQPAVSVSQYLAAGTYTFTYTYHPVSGQPAAPVCYHLGLLELSEDVGTYPPTTTTTTTTTYYVTDPTTTYYAPPPPSTLSLWYFF